MSPNSPKSTPSMRKRGLQAFVAALGCVALSSVSQAAGTPGAPVPPGPLGLDAPYSVYDPATDPGSTVRGATFYLVRGDFNGDGRMDVVNVTTFGAQVLLNQGVTAGQVRFARGQEIAARYSYGGNAIDMDGDGDLDLVLADVDGVVIALNDGTGLFMVTRPRTLRHGFRQATTAHAYTSRSAGLQRSGEIRIAVGAAADNVASDGFGSNPLKRPFLYVVRNAGGGQWSTVQQLAAINLDGVDTGDVNGDGNTDLLAADRSTYALQPFYLYTAGAEPPYSLSSAPSTAGFGFNFGYGPTVASNGGLAVATWHRAAVYRPLGGGVFAPPVYQSLDPFGAGFATGETFATRLADMDCDGSDDLVVVGQSTPVLLSRAGVPGVGPGVFVAQPTSGGTSMDLVVADFDQDVSEINDVMIGGSNGLSLLRNANGGGQVPPTPLPPTPGSEILRAFREMGLLLDPARMPVFGEDNPFQIGPFPTPFFFDEARNAVGQAHAALAALDPAYLTGNVISGATNAQRIASLVSAYNAVRNARVQVRLAATLTSDPAELAALASIETHLTNAILGIVTQAAGLGVVLPVPAKASAGGRTERRLAAILVRAGREQNAMFNDAAASRIVTDAAEQNAFSRTSGRHGARALHFLGRYWTLAERTK